MNTSHKNMLYALLRSKLTFVICFLGIGLHVNAQEKVLILKGYMIDLGFDIFFQPCNDTSIGLLSCFNKASFPLVYDVHNSKYTITSISKMIEENSSNIILDISSNYNNEIKFVDTVRYSYCELSLRIPNRNYKENNFPYLVSLKYNGGSYFLGGFSFYHLIENIKFLKFQ